MDFDCETCRHSRIRGPIEICEPSGQDEGEVIKHVIPHDPNMSGNIPVEAGEYGIKPADIVKNPDGSWSISRRMYIDDIARILLMLSDSDASITNNEKIHLAKFIDAMDMRCVRRDGCTCEIGLDRFKFPPLATYYE